MPLRRLRVVEGLEGSPVTLSWERTVEGAMLSSKNWASPVMVVARDREGSMVLL